MGTSIIAAVVSVLLALIGVLQAYLVARVNQVHGLVNSRMDDALTEVKQLRVELAASRLKESRTAAPDTLPPPPSPN